MIDKKNEAPSPNDQAERATWERPAMHRLEAADAEGATGNPAGDNVYFS